AAAAEAPAARAPAIFAALGARLAGTATLGEEVSAVIQFNVTDPDGAWTVRARPGDLGVSEGVAGAPDITITLTDADLTALVTREDSAQSLHQRGRLRIDGDVSVAHR